MAAAGHKARLLPSARRIALGTVVIALIALLPAVLAPEPAQASCGVIGFKVSDCLKDISDSMVGSLTNPFKAPIIQWMISVPRFASVSGKLGGFEQTSAAVGAALLGAVATLAVIQHWAAGFVGRGDITQAVTRTAGAGLFILAWPWIFDTGTWLADSVSHALMPTSSIDAMNKTLGGWDWAVQGASLLVQILLSIPLALMVFVLGLTKISLNAGLAAGFVGIPVAMALWPMTGMAWLSQWLLKVCTAAASVSVAWAAIMAAGVGLTFDFFTGAGAPLGTDPGTGQIYNNLTQPLVVVGLCIVLLKVSGMIMRTAGVTSSGGVGRAMFTFLASRFAMQALSGQLGASSRVTADRRADATERARRDTRRSIEQGRRDGRASVAEDQRKVTAQEAKARREAEQTLRGHNERAQAWRYSQHEVLSRSEDGTPRAPARYRHPVEAELETQQRLAERGLVDTGSATAAYDRLPYEIKSEVYRSIGYGSDADVAREEVARISAAPTLMPQVRDDLRFVGAGAAGDYADLRRGLLTSGPPSPPPPQPPPGTPQYAQERGFGELRSFLDGEPQLRAAQSGTKLRDFNQWLENNRSKP